MLTFILMVHKTPVMSFGPWKLLTRKFFITVSILVLVMLCSYSIFPLSWVPKNYSVAPRFYSLLALSQFIVYCSVSWSFDISVVWAIMSPFSCINLLIWMFSLFVDESGSCLCIFFMLSKSPLLVLLIFAIVFIFFPFNFLFYSLWFFFQN